MSHSFTLRSVVLMVCIVVGSCQRPSTDFANQLHTPKHYHLALKKLTDIIVHDIFSPPVASRIYVYANIAAYEALLPAYPAYQTLAGQLKDLTPPPAPEIGSPVDFHLASLHALLVTGKALVFSEEKMEAFQEIFYAECRKFGVPIAVEKASLRYGETIARHILDWASRDNYKQTRSLPKYTLRPEDAFWKPTPPDYMEGVEPHWRTIRPLVLDSASQFQPSPAIPFDMKPGSAFWSQVQEVYTTGKNLGDEEMAIARFWDCNPFVSHVRGHAMFATKKISPGGHWIGITGIAAEKTESGFMETVAAYTCVSIGLFDGFISCWDEKWRSTVIRPESVINKFVDEDWVPLLQTPPFPEYTSGHSVVSNASAEILSTLYGETFNYRDTSEMEFGLPARTFDSFRGAAREASQSRLYGGIHYRQAIEEGVLQGQKVGNWVLEKVRMKR